MMPLPLAHVFQMFVYIRAHFRFPLMGRNLTAQSMQSQTGIQIGESVLSRLDLGKM